MIAPVKLIVDIKCNMMHEKPYYRIHFSTKQAKDLELMKGGKLHIEITKIERPPPDFNPNKRRIKTPEKMINRPIPFCPIDDAQQKDITKYMEENRLTQTEALRELVDIAHKELERIRHD